MLREESNPMAKNKNNVHVSLVLR